MAYIIAEPCIEVKDKSCVEACPVDCIYEADDQLVIHPEECIDCGACVDPCPVDAIYHEDELPDKWQEYIAKNKDFFEGKTDLEPARKD
jgi:NAD-dependent dihydropyrimidine dehydrogenase PreA subunit